MSGLSVPEPHTDRTPVAQSVCHAIMSAGVATLAESNFAQINGFDVAMKHIIADAGMSTYAKWRADVICIQYSRIRTSLVKHPSSEDGATKANILMAVHRNGEQRIRQGSRHVYRFRSVTTGAAKCEMWSILIITELLYHIVIAIILIYLIRLSIEDSIWHTVTALFVRERSWIDPDFIKERSRIDPDFVFR